jgi:cell fate regulator YaaT (PSP1 superfamily)
VKDKKLDLKVVYFEFSFDATKAWVHFMAESRADTRDIGKEVAEALGLRAEWKQIGVRDHAAMVGGTGPCGRELCCSTFLKDYPAVSMRKAKDQNIPLNPNKLNGMCGRLKCCIAYEWGMSATGCEEHGSCERKYEPPGPEISEVSSVEIRSS